MSSGDLLLTMIKSERSALLSLDADFDVELCMIETLCGPSSKNRLLQKVLGCMPGQNDHHGPEATLHKVSQLGNTYLFKLADRAAQAKVEHVKGLLSLIVEGREPNVEEATQDPEFLAHVVSRFRFFVHSTTTGDNPTKIFGSDAVDALYLVAKNKHDNGQCKLENLTPLQVFRYLCNKESRDKVDALTKDVLGNAAEHLAAKAKGKIAKPKAKSSASSSSAGVADGATRSAMDLFM